LRPTCHASLRLATSIRSQVPKGPLDLQRETELAAAENRIKTAAQKGDFYIATVEDCILVTELTRGLDRPRIEVEDRYARAERLAKQYGTEHQQLECAYSKAWTTFWWYEDYKTFVGLYGEVERLVKGSRNAYGLLPKNWSMWYESL
jgi:hypothetical protein